MPTVKEKEIKDLLKAIKDGQLTTHQAVGYQQCCDVVPTLRRACQSTAYRDKFIVWWSRHKKKANQQLLLQSLPVVPPAAPTYPQVPPPTSEEKKIAAKAFCPSENPLDYPKPHKAPKKRVVNQGRPAPAPSPTGSDADDADYSFANDIFECDPNLFDPPVPTAPAYTPPPTKRTNTRATPPATPKTPVRSLTSRKTTPTTTPKASSSRSTPRSTPRSTTNTKRAALPTNTTQRAYNMEPVETPDERAARLITEQPADADSFTLVPGGQHNIAFFKWTWPDIQGTLHCTYFVKGAKAAVMVPGENRIKVSFNVVGEEEIKSVIEDFKGIVQAKLTKATVTKSMTTCEEYLDKLLEQKTRRNTVFGHIPIDEFEADEGFAEDLWGNGDFTTAHYGRWVTFTVRDKRRGRNMTGATTSLDQGGAYTSPARSSRASVGFGSPMVSPIPPSMQHFQMQMQQDMQKQQQAMQQQAMQLQQQAARAQAAQAQQMAALMSSFQGLGMRTLAPQGAGGAIVPSPRGSYGGLGSFGGPHGGAPHGGPHTGLPHGGLPHGGAPQGSGGAPHGGGGHPTGLGGLAGGLGDINGGIPGFVGGPENVGSPASYATAPDSDMPQVSGTKRTKTDPR